MLFESFNQSLRGFVPLMGMCAKGVKKFRIGYQPEHVSTGGNNITLSRPDIVKQLPSPSLPKLMAQFNPEQTG